MAELVVQVHTHLQFSGFLVTSEQPGFTMKLFVVSLLLVTSLVHAAPAVERIAAERDTNNEKTADNLHDPRQLFLVNRLSGQDHPGVVYYDSPVTRIAYYQAVPAAGAAPTRGVVDTIQGYFSQGVGFVSNQVTNLLPQPPYTLNVPDVVNGLVNRLGSGYQYVQNAWQNRPNILRPQTANFIPPINPEAEILPSDELIEAANQHIFVFAPDAPIATSGRL